LARAEAHARVGASSQARTALGSCMAIAQRNAYLPLLVSAHLVGAFLAERSGDLGGCGDELRTALEHATPELRDATLLRACARADGVTLEMLYRNVWGGREYHPLRHRNAVYVALTRLRESVASVLARDAFVEISDGRYRISPSVRVAVRRHWTGRIACRL